MIFLEIKKYFSTIIHIIIHFFIYFMRFSIVQENIHCDANITIKVIE